MKRIALVYSANPAHGMAGMDMIRWVRMGRGFKYHGFKVHLVTDRRRGADRFGGLKVKSASSVAWESYDAVKVCYQRSIDLVPRHPHLIVRMCRVVDEELPRRDSEQRSEILRCQERISEVASIVAFNDEENAARWRDLYGRPEQMLIVPTGCPEKIPPPSDDPFPQGRRIVLFCGSLTSHRFPPVLNQLARSLRQIDPEIEVHVLGKDSLRHYAGTSEPLDRSVVFVHEPVDEAGAWQYILHADVGLALAPSGEAFESELSKIYYYLRGGLPVVAESAVSNRSLVTDLAHGAIARYGDADDLVEKTRTALTFEPRSEAVMRRMAAHHGWRQRACCYRKALEARWR